MSKNGVIEHAGLVAAVEQAADAVLITDTAGKIQYVNPAFTTMTGYTSAEAVGQYPRILKSGRQSDALYQGLWNTVRSGSVWSGELINRRKDGSFYTEEMRITPVAGSDGRIISYIAIKHDVTGQRAADEARGFLAAIVESSGDAIVTYTPGCIIRSWNRGAEALFGHTAEEAIGKHVSLVVPTERLPLLPAFTQRILQGNAVPQYETVGLHKEGGRIPVSITGSPVKNSAGETVAVSVIYRDISALREGERRLQESEERFRGVFEDAPFGMCVSKLDGSFLQVNPEFCRMFGYTERELLAAGWREITHPGDREASQQMLARLVAGQSTREELEKRYIHRSGEFVWARTRIALRRDAAGAPMYLVVHVDDISQRRRAQEALRKSEELFRLFMDNSPAPAWMKDERGRYVYMNRPWQKHYGVEPEEHLGKSDFEIVPPEVAEEFCRNDRVALAAGQPITITEEAPGPDGKLFSWMTFKFRFEDVGGRMFVAGIALDVTERRRAEQVLQESEERFRIMADGCPTMMWVTDAEGGNQFINQAYREFAGTTYQEVEGRKWQLLLHPDDAAEYVRAFERALREHTPFRAEARVRRADGQWRWLASDAAPRLSSDGEFLGLVGLSPDITERRQAEQTLRSSEEKFRQLAENIREVFWMMDAGVAEMLYVSPAYEQIWGQPCAGLYANPESWMHSIHPEDRPRAQETFLRQARGEILENEYRIVRPSGDIRWIRDRAFPVRDNGGDMVRLAGIAEDITERKLAEFQLVHQALYDELTDLPNRRLFRESLGRAIAGCEAGQVGAVFFLDIDQFKLVNDTLGHAMGDQLLKEVAHRLRAFTGATGALARFGGDEFTLVATGFAGTGAVQQFGEQLVRCLDEPFAIADREIFVGASVGISLFPEHGADPHLLKTEANLAMHEAKRAGKNQIRFFAPRLAAAARERLDLEMKLRRGLALAEFKLQFQPQFARGRAHPSRFEALIRWCPPGEPPIPPSKFIPLAEQNGLIVPIGSWVLREACVRCAAWQTGDLRGAGVAVNVSALQFACPDFVETVERTLESAGLPAKLLELELTESVFLPDMTLSARTLAKLRALGVTIALDDFGTGYSSLSYLQNLDIDALKLDRGFLTQSEDARHGPAVMRCVIEMAHALGLRVIGEGVETIAQLDLLSGLGCDEIQGFLPGEPSFEAAVPAGAGTWGSFDWNSNGDIARLQAALAAEAEVESRGSR